MKSAAHFIVGGVAQTISAWVSGDVTLSKSQLIAHLTRMLDALAGPRLASPGQSRHHHQQESDQLGLAMGVSLLEEVLQMLAHGGDRHPSSPDICLSSAPAAMRTATSASAVVRP